MLETLFFIIVLIQAFFYLFFFSRFSFSNEKKNTFIDIPVSVIICAKNEANNLNTFLPFIISQQYKEFEIVLVNDHSSDNTLQVMQSLKDNHKDITIVNLSKEVANKKRAVTKGVQAAKHEHLLFIDADCKPKSKFWISEMAAHFTNNKIVLGYGPYEKKNSLLNKLIRFETLLTAVQYFSYAKANLAYMGVGRNLAYTKTLFNSVNGFDTHQHIKSGDDDLFINQVANNNVSCCYTEHTFTVSRAHTNFKKWLYQKRRHISTATVYKPIHQFLLGLFFISQFLFWFFTIYLIGFSNATTFVLGLVTFRFSIQYLIFGLSAKKLKETDLFLYLPFLELFLILVQLTIFIQNLISKPTKW